MIFGISSSAKRLLLAVTYRGDQIAKTFMIMTFFVLLFSYWVMISFGDAMWPSESLDSFNHCTKLYSCFIYHLDYGMRMGGGVGETMLTNYEDNPQYVNISLYQIVFFITINIIF